MRKRRARSASKAPEARKLQATHEIRKSRTTKDQPASHARNPQEHKDFGRNWRISA